MIGIRTFVDLPRDHTSWSPRIRRNRSPTAAEHRRFPTHSRPRAPDPPPTAPAPDLSATSITKWIILGKERTDRQYPHNTSSQSSSYSSTSSPWHTLSPCPSTPPRYPYRRGNGRDLSTPCLGRSRRARMWGSWCCIGWRGSGIFSRALGTPGG